MAATKRAARKTPAKQDAVQAKDGAKLLAYKAFNPDFSCRGFRFEVGKTYTHDGPVSICSAGFHACLVPFDCWGFYPESLTFADVALEQVSGGRSAGDSKVVGAVITIQARIELPEWIRRQVKVIGDGIREAIKSITATTGDGAHSATTGYGAHSATTGENCIAAALGRGGQAKSAEGSWIVLSEYDNEGSLLYVKSIKVGGEIKPDTYYTLQGGEFVEVQE